jgi:hypothetical protein
VGRSKGFCGDGAFEVPICVHDGRGGHAGVGEGVLGVGDGEVVADDEAGRAMVAAASITPMTTPSTIHFCRYEPEPAGLGRRPEPPARSGAHRSHPVVQSCSGTSPAASAS